MNTATLMAIILRRRQELVERQSHGENNGSGTAADMQRAQDMAAEYDSLLAEIDRESREN